MAPGVLSSPFRLLRKTRGKEKGEERFGVLKVNEKKTSLIHAALNLASFFLVKSVGQL